MNETITEVLEVLESPVSFAYERGYHELGYDPVQVVREAVGRTHVRERGAEAESLRLAFELLAENDDIAGEDILDILDRIDAGESYDYLGHCQDACRSAEKEVERLRRCMEVAGLQAFMRGKAPQYVADHLREVSESWGKIEKQRDELVKVLVDLFGWEDRSYLHAITHVENAVNSIRADLAVVKNERCAETEARVRELEEFAVDIKDNYDHDEDAHKHGKLHCCRCCKAEEIVGKEACNED